MLGLDSSAPPKQGQRKEKSAITFKIYERGIDEDGYNECTDTMVAILGKKRAKSQQAGRFPSWKSVLPDIAGMHHFFLSSEDVKEAQKWLSKVKTYSQYDSVNITAYKGSDLIYFDIDDNTRTFRLSAPSNITIGTKVNIKRLQSKKFCGFHLPKCGGGIIVDDANTDLTLLMPIEKCEPETYDYFEELEKHEEWVLKKWSQDDIEGNEA